MILSRRKTESTGRVLSESSERADTDSVVPRGVHSNPLVSILSPELMRTIPMLAHTIAWLVLSAITVRSWTASDRGLRMRWPSQAPSRGKTWSIGSATHAERYSTFISPREVPCRHSLAYDVLPFWPFMAEAGSAVRSDPSAPTRPTRWFPA